MSRQHDLRGLRPSIAVFSSLMIVIWVPHRASGYYPCGAANSTSRRSREACASWHCYWFTYMVSLLYAWGYELCFQRRQTTLPMYLSQLVRPISSCLEAYQGKSLISCVYNSSFSIPAGAIDHPHSSRAEISTVSAQYQLTHLTFSLNHLLHARLEYCQFPAPPAG